MYGASNRITSVLRRLWWRCWRRRGLRHQGYKGDCHCYQSTERTDNTRYLVGLIKSDPGQIDTKSYKKSCADQTGDDSDKLTLA